MRAAIFIDGGYLLKQLQDERINPDYNRLAAFLLTPLRRHAQMDLMRCYFYYCPPWMSEKPTEAELRRMAAHERFVAEIQDGCDRWQIRLGKLERRREGDKEVFAQKRVDVQLSVDLVHHSAAGHIQHAILVAGDSDFIPAIAAAKESGATLTLWCDQDRSVHKDLLRAADEVHFFDWKHFPSKAVERQDAAHGERPSKPEGDDVPFVAANDQERSPEHSPENSNEPSSEPAKKKRSRRRGGQGRKKTGTQETVELTLTPAAGSVAADESPSATELEGNIGNTRADGESVPVKTSKRRRGGRGRRRKTTGSATENSEPKP